MAVRSQLKKSPAVKSRQQMQLDNIQKFVDKYGEPMEKLFKEADRLKASYELANGTMQHMEIENDRRFWQNIYVNDSAKYIEVLSTLSKYMYSTIKQIELTNSIEDLPILEVKVTK